MIDSKQDPSLTQNLNLPATYLLRFIYFQLSAFAIYDSRFLLGLRSRDLVRLSISFSRHSNFLQCIVVGYSIFYLIGVVHEKEHRVFSSSNGISIRCRVPPQPHHYPGNRVFSKP